MKYMFLRFPEGKFKAVTFSYDDGSIHDLRLAKIFDKYGMKCTFNLHSGVIRHPMEGRITLDDVKSAFLENGHEVALHGKSHAALGITPAANGVRDTLDCRLDYESALDMIIRGYAYPDTMRGISGEKYDAIKGYLKELGIIYARAACTDFHDYLKDSDAFSLPDDFYYWIPTAHHDNKSIFEYIDRFLSLDEKKIYCASRHPRVLFIWGHSSEFEGKGRWDHIEEICGKLSDNEDIWYATSIEICEYVKAYEALVFSADCSKIYNPTLKKIWFYADGKSCVIEPGETLVVDS